MVSCTLSLQHEKSGYLVLFWRQPKMENIDFFQSYLLFVQKKALTYSWLTDNKVHVKWVSKLLLDQTSIGKIVGHRTTLLLLLLLAPYLIMMDLLGLLLCQAKLIVMRKLVPAAAKRILSSLMPEHVAWQQHVTRKKLPNIHKSCPKMIPLPIWYILTTLQKLPKNVGDLGKLIAAKGFKKLHKVQ